MQINKVRALLWLQSINNVIDYADLADDDKAMLLDLGGFVGDLAEAAEHEEIDSERMRDKAYIERVALTERG